MVKIQQTSCALLTLHLSTPPAREAPSPHCLKGCRSEKLPVSIECFRLAPLVWHSDNQSPRGDAQQVVQHTVHIWLRKVGKHVQNRHRIEARVRGGGPLVDVSTGSGALRIN